MKGDPAGFIALITRKGFGLLIFFLINSPIFIPKM